MKFASLAERIAGESVDAWSVHYAALARAAAGEDIIVLSVGQETSEPTPAPIVDAAVDSLRRGRHHYTDVHGELALREAIAARHAARSGQPVDAGRVSVFAGAQNALFAAAQCLLERGDEVILLEPYYTTYPATFSAGGAAIVSVRTRPEEAFRLDCEAVAAALTPRTRAVVVNTPNNPTGAVYTGPALAALVALCRERGIWLISDEVYAELAAPGAMVSPGGLPGGDEVCVTVSSVSKSHRMTGWRIGWVIGPPTLAGHLYNLAMCMCYGLPMFTQDAALAALRDDGGTAAEIRALLAARSRLVQGLLAAVPGVEVFAAGGGMFLVLDIRALGVPAPRFAQSLLDRHAVSVLPCDGFGAGGAGLLRLSLTEPEGRLRTACERLRAHVAATGWA